jgi:hypothetical protein
VGATWNTGAVTSAATNTYINSAGATQSVASIFLNANSFAFTGYVCTTGNNCFHPVGDVSLGFVGLNQSEITAAVIIHELLHVAGGVVFNDAGSDFLSGMNARTVRARCF